MDLGTDEYEQAAPTAPVPSAHDVRAREAARNNAEWCDALCRTHGVRGEFGAAAWTAAERTPPFYPDAVTLTPGAPVREVLTAVDTATPGCTVKDSFADLDLTGDGFEVLFDAQWIHRPAGAPVPAAPEGVRWARIRTEEELADWERAWDGGVSDLFRPELLADQGTSVLGGYAGDRLVAGAVATRSGSVVGVSNLFAADGTDPDAAWAGCLGALAELFPAAPVVGYEHGDDLTSALRNGFDAVGPLRIWLRSA
ncbi:hypothetical protein [Streptomyces sp. NBC_01014]|uniref:hypothetical protein n=1 Tax=Streptomyces sp. NBC_01014 TaxID=2903719 RepID=UPI00386E087C|nr:hypothetical protein OG282_10415 [Streptomyces sp. NBC_01014]